MSVYLRLSQPGEGEVDGELSGECGVVQVQGERRLNKGVVSNTHDF